MVIGIETRTFFTVIVHDRQDSEPFAIEQLIGHEIHTPDLMHTSCLNALLNGFCEVVLSEGSTLPDDKSDTPVYGCL